MGGTEKKNFTALLAQRFDWSVKNTSVGGTGYASPGGKDFEMQQLGPAAEAKPDLLVVFGSRNDMGLPGIGQAANKLYADAKVQLPATRIVIVGPPWINDFPPPQILEVRDIVSAAAASASLTFIDPIAEGWFAGPSASLIGSDNVHPSDAGHQHMAQLLGDDLERLRAAPESRR